jgi:uncharacterized phage protein gp47/JayE
VARELAVVFSCLDDILSDGFADTAEREYLTRRAGERYVVPHAATSAVWRAEFSIDVDLGSRFSLDELTYIVTERISEGQYKVTCETPGEVGNALQGDLIPIEYIDGLETAALVELLIPGEDEEDTEAFRARYFESVAVQAFAGNKAAYIMRTKEVPGVGGVKVYPAWLGGGTTRLVITSSQHLPPSQALVEEVQREIDPKQDGGGDGVAPIGHVVTVEGATSVPVDIAATLEYETDYSWSAVSVAVLAKLTDYYAELAKTWEQQDAIIVRVSHIESRILSVPGVADISGTAVNGSPDRLTLGADEVPVRGAWDGA